MVTLVSVLVSVLTNFFSPAIGGLDSNVEGSDRFGLVVEDPRDMAQEENGVTHWQYCP
jgi:hypothetical protein